MAHSEIAGRFACSRWLTFSIRPLAQLVRDQASSAKMLKSNDAQMRDVRMIRARAMLCIVDDFGFALASPVSDDAL